MRKVKSPIGSVWAMFTVVFTAVLLSFGPPLGAQEAEPQVDAPATNTQLAEDVGTHAQIDPSAESAPISSVDADQIAQKLEALETAEAEFLAAMRAQAKAGQIADPESELETETAAKKSLIPKNLDEVKALGLSLVNKVISWLTSPAFLAQLGAIFIAYVLSPILSKQLTTKIFLFRDEPADGTKLRVVRDYIYRSREFLRAVILVALLALFAVILKAVPVLGQDWLVKLAQGLAVVFLLYKAIKTFIANALIQKLALWIIIPLALLMVFGYFGALVEGLNGTVLMSMGGTPITAMTLVRLVIFGALFFKLGNYSNSKGQTAIRSQEGMDTATQEVVSKMLQISIFTIMVVMILSAAKVPLSGLVMIFSAMSLGIGLGLQPIASNFVSGMIILFDRSVKVGDFVVLPDGQSGFVEAINMRSTTVETPDGKDIMVPNTQFTEDAYENWTHKDPRQRYEVEFSVHYDTDLDSLEDILIPAVLKHPQVLKEPEMPDLELRSLGENGANMAIEFWCDGIDDGPNKFTSDVNFIVWRTLKKHGIQIPYPQHEVRVLK